MTRPTDATLELLERLVALDSTSTRSNLPVIDAVEEALLAVGAWTRRVPATGPSWAGDEPKAGLLARIGPDVDGGVVLSGHTDCVPVDGQPWTVDPFALTERDGMLYGRGTTDMKGFIAAATAVAAPAAAAATLARPLWMLLTWDEEVGTAGAPAMTEALLAHTRPAAAIVGEPTSMRVADAHKGVRSQRVTVHGSEGHSSRPDLFANALVGAARIVVHIDEVGRRLAEQGGAPRFTPPYTTVGVNLIESGTAVNIIPREASFLFEYRPVPSDDSWAIAEEVRAWSEREVLAGMRELAPDAHVEWREGPIVRGLAPDPDGGAAALVASLLDSDDPTIAVPFGTDGGWHQEAGVPTVVCGPGNIEQAHQPDEWMDPADLARCETMLTALVDHLANP